MSDGLDQIRRRLEGCIGCAVKVKANRGRKKVIEATGVLEQTYSNLFVIKLDDQHPLARLSYTYTDLLTETVELTIDEEKVEAGA